jgi:hypothetical protein
MPRCIGVLHDLTAYGRYTLLLAMLTTLQKKMQCSQAHALQCEVICTVVICGTLARTSKPKPYSYNHERMA